MAAFAFAVSGSAPDTAGALRVPERPLLLEDLGKGRALTDGHRSPLPRLRQSLGDLAARWGEPDRVRPVQGECIATWPDRGVVAYLANYAGGAPCSYAGGLIQTLEIRSSQWRTTRGLRIGDPVARVKRLYPKSVRGTQWYGNQRLLRPYLEPCIGDCGKLTKVNVAAVRVGIKNGRVSQFYVSIRAAGE